MFLFDLCVAVGFVSAVSRSLFRELYGDLILSLHLSSWRARVFVHRDPIISQTFHVHGDVPFSRVKPRTRPFCPRPRAAPAPPWRRKTGPVSRGRRARVREADATRHPVKQHAQMQICSGFSAVALRCTMELKLVPLAFYKDEIRILLCCHMPAVPSMLV